MSDRVDLVRVLTSATGNSSPITLGVRYSDQFMTPADAGAIDGRTYTWLISDVIGGSPAWELVKGVYTASGTSMSRTKVLASRSGGTLGTSRITLSGTAQVRIVEAAEDMGALRGTRSVTSTSDTIANTDLARAIVYNNASAVAASLAQGGTAGLDDGWTTYIQNLGAGAVTITPATSTINGAPTLSLSTNIGAFIWSDGTNYHAYFIPVSKPLLAASNLADVASSTAARNNLGIPAIMRSYLAGLTLSTAGGSGTFGVSAGVATDSTNADVMALASAYTKTTGAWAVGSGNGALDAGSINNFWYHVHLIKRPDTGVVDVLISLSATAPTLPTNYTLFRRIGSMHVDPSAHWTAFTQVGETFYWSAVVQDVNTTTLGTTAVLFPLTVPTGVQVRPILRVLAPSTQTIGTITITSPSEADVAPGAGYANSPGFDEIGSSSQVAAASFLYTDTSANIRARSGAAAQSLAIYTRGWLDDRGKFN